MMPIAGTIVFLLRGAAFISARLCCKLGQDRRSGANAVLTEFN
ncbi:MAG: hypothetical protein ACYDGX_05370 [Thermoleophilia bacterium]